MSSIRTTNILAAGKTLRRATPMDRLKRKMATKAEKQYPAITVAPTPLGLPSPEPSTKEKQTPPSTAIGAEAHDGGGGHGMPTYVATETPLPKTLSNMTLSEMAVSSAATENKLKVFFSSEGVCDGGTSASQLSLPVTSEGPTSNEPGIKFGGKNGDYYRGLVMGDVISTVRVRTTTPATSVATAKPATMIAATTTETAT